MEALSFLKFWRPTTTGNPNPITEADVEEEEEEEDDSFFDLELSIDDDFKDFDFHKPPPNHSSEPFSKRKINPIQASPIALLKSAPKLLVFKKRTSSGEDPGVSDASISKRFSRCLKLIYVKKSKKNGDRSTLSAESSSPARKEKQRSADFGIRVVCKNLRKCKSSLSAAGIESPARRDDSLLLQHDGIQSAILHCKRSFNSSRESSMLSRLSSDSVQDSIKLSTSDSSVLSRYSSDKWMDSARSSSEDGCAFRACCFGKEEEKALFPCILGVKNDSCSAEIEN